MKTMIKQNVACVMLLCLSITSFGQTIIVPPALSEYYITPILAIGGQAIATSSGDEVEFYATLTDIQNGSKILEVKSGRITLKAGINSLANLRDGLSFTFMDNNVGNYLMIHHKLPDGRYRYCFKMVSLNGEENLEECYDLEARTEILLNLVYPQDNDTIETTLPVLNWTHSGGNDLVGYHFKLNVVEVLKDQPTAVAIRENTPVLIETNVKSLAILYPASASKLERGKSYAWQIELWDESRPVQYSEVWKFTIQNHLPTPVIKYVKLRKNQNAGVYDVVDDRVYFNFEQGYASIALPRVTIEDSRGHEMLPVVKKDGGNSNDIQEMNDHHYILDLAPYNLTKGTYVMKVLNQKNDKFELTLYVD